MCDRLLAQWRRDIIDNSKFDHLVQVVNGDYTNLADVFDSLVVNLSTLVVKERTQITNKTRIAGLITTLFDKMWVGYGYLASVGLCLRIQTNADLRECLVLAGNMPKQYTFLTKVLNCLKIWSNIDEDMRVDRRSLQVKRITKTRSSIETYTKIWQGRKLKFYRGKIYFEKLKQWIRLNKVIGLGGCGSVIYSGKSATEQKFAVKQVVEMPGEKMTDDFGLTPFYESLIDPMSICTEVVQVGRSAKFMRFTVLELGTQVSFSTFKLVDVISVMEDLIRLENYRKAGLTDHIDFKLMLVHLDIHGGNFINTEKGVRLIDWGLSFLCNQDPASKDWLQQYKTKFPLLATRKTQLFRSTFLEPYNQELVKDWVYGVTKGGKPKLKLTCSRLMKKHNDDVLKVKNVSREMEQCLRVCNELLFSITKDILSVEKKQRRDMGVIVRNSESVYSIIMLKIMPIVRSKKILRGKFLIVESIVLWYDILMVGCLEGKNLTAKDGLKFFSRHMP